MGVLGGEGGGGGSSGGKVASIDASLCLGVKPARLSNEK